MIDHDHETPGPEPQAAPWLPTTLQECDRVLYRILQLEREREDLKAQWQASDRRLAAEIAQRQARYLPVVEQLALAALPSGRKFIDLPHGRLQFRAVAAKARVSDPAAWVAFATTRAPAALRVTATVSECGAAAEWLLQSHPEAKVELVPGSLSWLLEAAPTQIDEATGEVRVVIPGLEITAARDSMSFAPAKGRGDE